MHSIGEINTVLCNVYLPSGCDKSDKNHEYTDVLNTVSCTLHIIQSDYVIVGGDINTDFRSRNSKNSSIL